MSLYQKNITSIDLVIGVAVMLGTTAIIIYYLYIFASLLNCFKHRIILQINENEIDVPHVV